MSRQKLSKRENPRQAARKAAHQLRAWIASTLAGAVCSECGDALSNGVCSCGSMELDPSTFEAEEVCNAL